MSNFIRERQNRRTTILEGFGRGLSISEIAAQLRVNRWVVMNDLKMMRKSEDPELVQAERVRELSKEEQRSPSSESSERFLLMTGKTFQEKSFQNMIDFYRPELMKVLGSGDQYSAIMDLPKSVRRTLIQNGIITNRRRKREITLRALELLIGA
jgi:hypothetical protein